MDIIEAVNANNVEELRKLIKAGADVNFMDAIGKCAPLHIAVGDGYFECFNELIAAKADLEVQFYNNQTPLHLAAEYGKVEMMKTLLDAGANIYALDDHDQQPLHLACGTTKYSNPECIDILIKAGADVNAPSDYGTALILAASSGDANVVEKLIQAGAYVNTQDQSLNTPLHYAVLTSSPQMCQNLIDAGANLNNQNFRGETPLHTFHYVATAQLVPTSDEKTKECASILIKAGADLHVLNNESKTPEDLEGVINVFRDARIAKEKSDLEKEGQQNLPDRPTPRISRGRL